MKWEKLSSLQWNSRRYHQHKVPCTNMSYVLYTKLVFGFYPWIYLSTLQTLLSMGGYESMVDMYHCGLYYLQFLPNVVPCWNVAARVCHFVRRIADAGMFGNFHVRLFTSVKASAKLLEVIYFLGHICLFHNLYQRESHSSSGPTNSQDISKNMWKI